ncbi:MAG TPA: sortase, partial [Ilumatobacteraceae bacterium]|nr:sortase [Ilumatobacteraceae bacterium]
YQLWGTGIQTARAQSELRDDFEAALQSTTTLAPTTTASTDPTDSIPDSVPTATSTTVPIAEATPAAADGDWLGQIHIPRIGVDKIYVEGTSVASLRDGPGHFRETPMPGQLGNAAIAGHRTTYGAPFGRLDELQIGDDIQVQTLVGTYLYRVTETYIVEPGDYLAVIPSPDPSIATLTLVTCTPEYTSSERLVVRGTLVADQSSQVFQPPSVTAPANTTPTTVPDNLPPEGGPDTVESTDSVPGSTDTVPTTEPTTTTTIVVAENAFSQGWFDDDEAPPHVFGWFIVLALIVLGSYWAGRWANRLWVCWVVGIVPFTIGLYFFYENVSRMLPPSL